MPYLNKRNRFISAAKQYAEDHSKGNLRFTKDELKVISSSINMKGIPTWVLKDLQTGTKGIYDLTSLIVPAVTV
jgi:hypothetical protein